MGRWEVEAGEGELGVLIQLLRQLGIGPLVVLDHLFEERLRVFEGGCIEDVSETLRQFPLRCARYQILDIALEVGLTALPLSSLKMASYRSDQSFVLIGDDQQHPCKSTFLQRAE